MTTIAPPVITTSIKHIENHNNVLNTVLDSLSDENGNTKTITHLKSLIGNVIKTRSLISEISILPESGDITKRYTIQKTPDELSNDVFKQKCNNYNQHFLKAVEDLAEKKLGMYLSNSKLGQLKIKDLIGHIVNQEAYTIGLIGKYYKNIKKPTP